MSKKKDPVDIVNAKYDIKEYSGYALRTDLQAINEQCKAYELPDAWAAAVSTWLVANDRHECEWWVTPSEMCDYFDPKSHRPKAPDLTNLIAKWGAQDPEHDPLPDDFSMVSSDKYGYVGKDNLAIHTGAGRYKGRKFKWLSLSLNEGVTGPDDYYIIWE